MRNLRVLKHLRSGWPLFGPIFKCDGVQLQLTVENDPKLEKEAATKKAQATKKKLASGTSVAGPTHLR